MQKKRSFRFALSTVTAAIAVSGLCWWNASTASADTEYEPSIKPTDFVASITNKYFTLKPGTKFVFENNSALNKERIEVVVTKQTKKIMGVTTTEVRVTEWAGDNMKEDTMDYYAQDNAGNVWYFGEVVNNYKDGKIANHNGSWEAGVDGAKPGIIMMSEPKVGETYRQEYYKGKAEDMGTVIAVGTKETVRYGKFDDCVEIRDWSKIESAVEYKYYCANVGFTVRERPAGVISAVMGGVVELVSVTSE